MTDYQIALTGVHARNEKTIQATQDWERGRIDEEGLRRSLAADVEAVVELQHELGVDYITDGQLTLAWQDLFRPMSKGFAGLEPGPMVRWFNTNTFFFTPVVKGEISSDGKALSSAVERKLVNHGSGLKIIIPDPLTFAQLADDRHYKSKEKLLFAYSDAVNTELRSLVSLGVNYVQFSAPGLVYRMKQGPLASASVKQLGEAVRNALKGVSMRSGFYPFFGDASSYLPTLFDVIPTDDIGLDLTQTDDSSLSSTSKGIIAGIVDSRTTYVEDVTSLASRILRVVELTGAKRLTLSPSADLRYVPRVSADEKLELLGRLRARVKKGARFSEGKDEEEIEMTKAFPTQEIGSLPKFGWRTKPFRQMALNDDDLEVARQWGDRLEVNGRGDLYSLLAKRYAFTEEEKKTIVDFSLLYAIRICETAGQGIANEPGLDLVWSGEQARTEMYETPVSNIGGFEFVGRVRSFDNKYWRMASIRSPPKYKENYHLDELLFTEKHSDRKVKVPVTDAITIMAWSDNNYYTGKWANKDKLPPAKRSFSARREFTLELAKIIRTVIRELIEKGVEEIQIDIPAATQYQSEDDIKLVAESFNETTKGLSATFSVHSCFPPSLGYGILFPHILEMSKCERFSFEYGNRDTFATGLDAKSRVGFEDLKLFREYGYKKQLGVGVIHIHTDTLPSAQVVRDRVLYSEKVTDLPQENIYVNPDCGLRTRRPEIAQKMLDLTVVGAELARRASG